MERPSSLPYVRTPQGSCLYKPGKASVETESAGFGPAELRKCGLLWKPKATNAASVPHTN